MAAACLGSGTAAQAVDLFEIGLPDPVTALRQDASGSFVTVGDVTYRLEACETPAGACLQTIPRGTTDTRIANPDLPDGFVATAADGDIRKAWYGQPTDRYAHGVLGDAIEGGSLIVVDEDGKKREFVLPEAEVFEDIAPRIRDLDGDGLSEVVTIRSSQTGGSAVAIYGLRDGALVELGASSENGQPNRWLNIAGFIDNADGGATVYGVRTPHIGGRLFSLTYTNGTVSEEDDIADNVSDHVIGSRELGLSTVCDFDGDGRDDLVLPSQDRTRLRFPLSNMPDIALPGAIDKAMACIGGRIAVGTQDGRLLIVAH